MEAAFRQLWRKFQSTLSVRRATVSSLIVRGQVGISIHVLRKESDGHRHSDMRQGWNFNPRSP